MKVVLLCRLEKMAIHILAIGDTVNAFGILKKYVKKSQIKIIRTPGSQRDDIFVQSQNQEFFKSSNILGKIKRINSIKNDFDLCVVNSWGGAIIAYLCDLNYIMYFLGNDIRSPPFVKNPQVPRPTISKRNLNFIERKFYKDVLENAIVCVAYGDELYDYLRKYRKDAVRADRFGVDKTIFNKEVKPLDRKKQKFTFFSPQRIDLEKGIDIIWEAIPLCKTDFEVIQVEWYSRYLEENPTKLTNLLKKKPPQVTLIPMIINTEINKYYAFSDAVIGQVGIGSFGSIEREAVFSKKAVICYLNPKYRFKINGKKIPFPFPLKTNDPVSVARIIDQVVESKEFREKLASDEYQIITELFDPEKWANECDEFFMKLNEKFKTINKNSSTLKVKFRMFFFVLGKSFHFRLLKKYYSDFRNSTNP